ncbi:MAG: chemotaxis protein CheX [Oligoflexia bacterium]|nr:chemotaxis protein CheX [Oligoflexia bacterium]
MKALLLDDALSATVIRGVCKSFSELFASPPTPGEICHSGSAAARGDVSGILGMIQERPEASLVLSFPKDTICALISRIYGRPFPEIDRSVREGVGELTNVLYAAIKKDLNDRGHEFKMSIPSVISGQDFSVAAGGGETLLVPFMLKEGPFCVEITLLPAQDPR